MLDIGERAPDFETRDHVGRRVALSELTQRGPTVLYFYPRDFTPTCTRQARLFRDAHQELARHRVTVVAVSTDRRGTHASFAEQHSLPFGLLADEDRRIATCYGALRFFGFINRRVTYVIDQSGLIIGRAVAEFSAIAHLNAVRVALGLSAAAEASDVERCRYDTCAVRGDAP
jgi:peroxiredoxin